VSEAQYANVGVVQCIQTDQSSDIITNRRPI
jgi:hypothetical protein